MSRRSKEGSAVRPARRALIVGAGAATFAAALVGTAVASPATLHLVNASSTSAGGSATAAGIGRGQHGRGAAVSGTVASVNAPSFVVTRKNGSKVTVTTSSTTRFTKTSTATAADATAGTWLTAKGTRAADGSLAASVLWLVPTPAKAPTVSSTSPATDSRPFVYGQVVSNSGGTLTVATTKGSEKLTTSSSTKITKTTTATIADVTTGATVEASGHRTADGAIAATRVNIGSLPPKPGLANGRDRSRGDRDRNEPTTSTSSSSTTSSTVAPGAASAQSTDNRDNRPKAPGSPMFGRGVSGTVAGVNGTQFTVTRQDGSTVTVTTSGDTRYTKTVTATAADASTGTWVAAKGTRNSDGSLSAFTLWIFAAPKNAPAMASSADAQAASQWGPRGGAPYAFGPVTANYGTTITITTREGTQKITTTSTTKITKTSDASFADLATGSTVQVVGARNADGTLAAQFVHIGAVPMPEGGFRFRAPGTPPPSAPENPGPGTPGFGPGFGGFGGFNGHAGRH